MDGSSPESSETGLAPVGRLDDGSPYYAPIGELLRDEDGAMCHLCGRWLRIVGGAHLTKMHGLDVATYREMFKLASTTPTCSLQQSSARRVVTARRAATEPGFGEISAEVRERGARVPRRLGRWRSLAATRPEVAAELHPTRNGELDPFAVWPYSSRELWWRCSGCGQEWRDTPAHRSEGRGCPLCTRTAVLVAARTVPRERSLAVLNSAVAAELHPTRNGGLDPYTLGASANQKVWWVCGTCGHEWRAIVDNRHHNGVGCPICGRARGAAATGATRRRVPAERSLAALRPDLAAELHRTRNPGVRADELGVMSRQLLWWQCSSCGQEWQARPGKRTASGCPTCARARASAARRKPA
ncbi:MAG: zinc-ribbon domain-containing protein [Solirubrobacteraceae bacterium]